MGEIFDTVLLNVVAVVLRCLKGGFQKVAPRKGKKELLASQGKSNYITSSGSRFVGETQRTNKGGRAVVAHFVHRAREWRSAAGYQTPDS